MKRTIESAALLLIFAATSSLYSSAQLNEKLRAANTADTLPPPFQTKSTKNFSKVIGWKDGTKPAAPQGFTVSRFAGELEHPRWVYQGPNGDVFVAESNTVLKGLLKLGAKISRKIKTHHYGESANRITMFRDADKDGIPERRFVFAENLNQPFGMLILKDHFYVANTDALWQYDYHAGDSVIRGNGRKILSFNVNKPNQHWTRNIIANDKGDKIYIAVGSGTNVAEKGVDKEHYRAMIMEINPDGSGLRVYASGLRNPVGMDWAPGTSDLWTAVNERDLLGDELVPDYLAGVKEGGFYGWPFAYFGPHPDPRMKDNPMPELVNKTIVPDVQLGSHTASLGLKFYNKDAFPAKYRNGAFITQHGSWNRAVLSGYKVVFVPFTNGKPAGEMEDFLTGFIVEGSTDSEVRGRPVGLEVLADGSMLVSDDVNNIIWRISADQKK